MDKAEVRNIVIREAQLSMDAQQISDTLSLDDAGITSLARMNIILALEDRFQITFPDEIMTRNNFASIAAISKTVDGVLFKTYGSVGVHISQGGQDYITRLNARA